jgi:hypothetical protein
MKTEAAENGLPVLLVRRARRTGQSRLRPGHRAGRSGSVRDRPEILTPPEHPPACCNQQTITVPPEVNAKTLRTQSATSASPLKSASMTAIPVSASAEFRPGSPSGGARRRMSANERRSVK